MQNGKTASYTYNGDGLRMSKTVDGKTTKHIWDGTDIVGDVTDGTVTKYIRGLQLISSNNGNNESFYTYNGHGDVVQLTNSTGAITKQYNYDAFGVETNKTNNDTNPFRYCGEYYDIETDKIYLRSRYYSPILGCFTSEDLIKDGQNWYIYCGGNPIMFIDTTGLKPRRYQPELWNNTDVQYRTNCYAYALDFCGVVSYGNYQGTSIPIDENTYCLQPGNLKSPTKTLLHKLYESYAKDGIVTDWAKRALSGAMLDSRGNGHTFRPATSANIEGRDLGENEWVVYLVASKNQDYHWYRQNADENGNFDGTWSHKPGTFPVTNREVKEIIYTNSYYGEDKKIYSNGEVKIIYGDIITDPTKISRTIITSYRDSNDQLLLQYSFTYDMVVGAFVVGY